MFCIGVDVGSSYLKAALLDVEGNRVLNQQRVDMPARLPDENELIHQVPMDSISTVMREAVERCAADEQDVRGVVLSTQMHGFVLSDAEYGPDIYVSWQDARCLCPMPGTGGSYLEALEKLVPPEDMRNTGVYLKPALGMCNLYALMHSRGFRMGKNATVYTLGSYLIEKLTGRNVCHITNAAPLGLVDIRQGVWRRDLIERLGLGGLRFPELETGLRPCGQCRIGGRSLTVYPDIGDVQATVYGSGAQAGDVIVNMATGGQVIMVKPTTDIGKGDPSYYEVRPYFNGDYCHVISRMPGGRNMDVLIDFFRQVGQRLFDRQLSREEIWGKLLETANPEDTQGLGVDVSFYELPEKLSDGAILHIDRTNLTVDHILGGALRDIGQVYARYIRLLAGDSAQRLVFCGGAARGNPLVQRALTGATGLPGIKSPLKDEVYWGMLKIARAALNMECGGNEPCIR